MLTDEQAEVEVELARITSRLLDADYLPTFNFQRVAAETRDAAAKLGLLRDGVLRHAEARAFLRTTPFNSLLQRTGILNLGPNNFAAFLKGDKVVRHPIPAIAIITALAGNWQSIEKRAAVQSDPSVEIEKTNSKAVAANFNVADARSPERVAKDIERYKRLRAARPQWTHSELRRRSGKSARHYLNRELLMAAGVDIPPRPPNVATSDTLLVELLIAHVKQRSRHLKTALYPGRITGSTLMATFYRPRIFKQKRMVERLGPAHTVLLRHTETHAEWRKRIEAMDERKHDDRKGNARGATTAAATKSAADQEN